MVQYSLAMVAHKVRAERVDQVAWQMDLQDLIWLVVQVIQHGQQEVAVDIMEVVVAAQIIV
jgi:NTP pyrophosphatase (non-canonical NTP hydrolase)